MIDDIFLLDTNVISNSSKTSPLPTVAAWLDRQRRLAIPFAAILEIETGIAELWPVDPVRAKKLTEWIDGLLKTKFYYPPSTPEVARVLAKLYCCRHLRKLWYPEEDKKPGQDLFIAAVSIDVAPKFYPILSSLRRFLVAAFGAVVTGCGAEPFRLRSTASRRGLMV